MGKSPFHNEMRNDVIEMGKSPFHNEITQIIAIFAAKNGYEYSIT